MNFIHRKKRSSNMDTQSIREWRLYRNHHEEPNKTAEGEGGPTLNGNYVQPNFWVLPKVFQFPKDDEVTV